MPSSEFSMKFVRSARVYSSVDLLGNAALHFRSHCRNKAEYNVRNGILAATLTSHTIVHAITP